MGTGQSQTGLWLAAAAKRFRYPIYAPGDCVDPALVERPLDFDAPNLIVLIDM